MRDPSYNCTQCGRKLSYVTTKHNGCPDCGHLPLHGAD